MKLFFTDLDNTLIYSHRHEYEGEKKWVEMLKGRQQSFMTERSFRFLKGQKGLKIVPVTTRTRAQYARLFALQKELGFEDALILNGAIRLYKGEEDLNWTNESERLCKAAEPAYLEAYEKCAARFGAEQIVKSGIFMFYVKSARVQEDYQTVISLTDRTFLTVLKDSRKIYVFPSVMNKGTAVRRYMALTQENECIAAGDSVFDLPMLLKADLALCHHSLRESLPQADGRLFLTDYFSDSICAELEKADLKGDIVDSGN